MLTDATPQLQDEDLGYGLGWLCGAILIVGVIVGALAASKGRRRRAFQAFVQPVAAIATIVLLILFLAALEELTGRWNTQEQDFAFVMVIIGAIAAPLPVQYILQKMRWPAVS